MLYPLYDYYRKRDCNLDEIVDHFVSTFYAKRYGVDKAYEVFEKIISSDKIKNLCGQSATRGIAPNYVDFSSVVHSILWFIFKSNLTIALATLYSILYWDEKINTVYCMKSDEDVKEDAIKIFDKFQIYEDMTY